MLRISHFLRWSEYSGQMAAHVNLARLLGARILQTRCTHAHFVITRLGPRMSQVRSIQARAVSKIPMEGECRSRVFTSRRKRETFSGNSALQAVRGERRSFDPHPAIQNL